MVSALVSGSRGLGSSPGLGHCVVFLGLSLHPVLRVGTGEFIDFTYLTTSDIAE